MISVILSGDRASIGLCICMQVALRPSLRRRLPSNSRMNQSPTDVDLASRSESGETRPWIE
jgi:hypothetical protein